MRRLTAIALMAGMAACGAPSVQEAAHRRPAAAGATEVFGRPYAEVYAAAKEVIAHEAATPEWKELRVVHDDPEAGVLVAERRLEGIIPGLRTRDLWSFYFDRPAADRTTVTFVFDSSDRLAATAGVRSWMKARSAVFPAMVEVLGPPVANPGAATASAETGERHTAPERPTAGEPEPSAAAGRASMSPPSAAATPRAASLARAPTAAASPAPAPAPALTLERVYTALQGSEEWRRATRRRTLAGEEIVTVGDWAQLEVRGEHVAIAFPSYPAPPAYDVARLVSFLGDAGFRVDVLPGTAFRAP